MFTFKLTDEAGEVSSLKADSRDVLVWEKTSKSGERYIDLITEMSLIKFYRLAHIVAKREGVFSGSLKEFEAAYVVDLEHQEDVLPTNAEVSTET
jgi:hypothetical protein